MTEGVTLSVFLLPDNPDSARMERKVLTEVLPHLPGTDAHTITFLCDNVDADIVKRFCIGTQPKAIILCDGRKIAEFAGDIPSEMCQRTIRRLTVGIEPDF